MAGLDGVGNSAQRERAKCLSNLEREFRFEKWPARQILEGKIPMYSPKFEL